MSPEQPRRSGIRAEPLNEIDELVSLIRFEIDRTRSVAHQDVGDFGDPQDRTVLDRLAMVMASLLQAERPVPAIHPAVERWLESAVGIAPEPQRRLAETFRSVAPHLAWKTAYAGAPSSPIMRRFWADYAYASLVSPDDAYGGTSPLRSAEVNLYLVIQGAHVDYGRHHHLATEVYGIVSGTAQWLRGDDFRSRRPGDVFVHQPDVMHATTTGDEPTISWVAWLGDLNSQPLLETGDGRVIGA